MINSRKISQFQRLSLHMSWLCRKYHVILRLNISSFEHLSKYRMLSHLSMTCFSLEACIPPLHQSLKHTLIFKQLNHASQQFGQKEVLFCPPFSMKGYLRKQGQVFTCNGLSAAEYSHVSIISDEHELAADAHVHAAQNHDGPRQHAPQHQEEECSTIRIITSFIITNITSLP